MIDRFTVGENIALALELQECKKINIKNRVKEILREVDLENYENRRISEISGGEKQRVAIARALIKNPQIILANEPTGNLDSESSNKILEILKKLSKDKLVIIVTHEREFAQTYGDRVIELQDGEIIKDSYSQSKENDVILKYEVENNKLKKTILPFHFIIKSSINSLFAKKIRLLMILFLFSATITFLTVAANFTFYDVTQASILTFKQANENNIPIIKYASDTDLPGYEYNMISFSDNEITSFQKKYPSIDFIKTIRGAFYSFSSPNTFYSSELYQEQGVQRSTIHIILYLAAVFSVFTIIMIFTFMTTTIAAKQKEIGILKALGARGKDLFIIFSIETLLIVIISNLISGILTAFAINMQNTQIKEVFSLNINILYLNYISILTVLGLSIVIISISTLAPILKITLMKPIQAIRKAN